MGGRNISAVQQNKLAGSKGFRGLDTFLEPTPTAAGEGARPYLRTFLD